MQLINITYDTSDDIDIVSVPNKILDDLDKNVQDFFDWTITENSGCWNEINGQRFCCVGRKISLGGSIDIDIMKKTMPK